jgi:Putative MetA-pathway of phenol degradation
MRSLFAALPFLAISAVASAEEKQIQDNSFLLEEAYNQEPAVVQTIQSFTRTRGSGDWSYTLTQEWPVPGETHQLSFTLPVEHAGGTSTRGLGDLLLNYRYQLVGSGETRVAVAPRLSAIVPTGSDKDGRGNGSWGAQVSLPLSLVVTPRIVTHTNVGATWLPSARREDGGSGVSASYSVGQSVIWLAHPSVNVLVESLYTHTKASGASAENELIVAPGLRAAINVGQLQIVPGLAFQLGVGPSSGQRSVFLYLSFEHPMWSMKSRD